MITDLALDTSDTGDDGACMMARSFFISGMVTTALLGVTPVLAKAPPEGTETRELDPESAGGGCAFADAWLDTEVYAWEKPYLVVGDTAWRVRGKEGRETLASITRACADNATGAPDEDAEVLVGWLNDRREAFGKWRAVVRPLRDECLSLSDEAGIVAIESPDLEAVKRRCEQGVERARKLQMRHAVVAGSRTSDTIKRSTTLFLEAVKRADDALQTRKSAAATFRAREEDLRVRCVATVTSLDALADRVARCSEWEALAATPPRDAVVAPESREAVFAARAAEPEMEAALRRAVTESGTKELSTCTTSRVTDRATLDSARTACDHVDTYITGAFLPATAAAGVKAARARLVSAEATIAAREAAEKVAAQRAFDANVKVARDIAWEVATSRLSYPSMAQLIGTELLADDGKDSFMYRFDVVAPNAYGNMRRAYFMAGITILSARARTYTICRKSGISAAGQVPEGWNKRDVAGMIEWCP